MYTWIAYGTVGLVLAAIYLAFGYKPRLSAEGRSVLITGCDSGIGLYLAESLHDRGFHVLAACLFSSSDGYKKLSDIKYGSDRMHTLIMDVTDEQSVQGCFEEVKKITKSDLWAVINNAGICVFGEFDWLTWNQCDQQVSVNFLGAVRITKYFLPLIKRSSGRILAISSVAGFVALPGTAVYSATKFALEGFYDSLRIELRKLGINVVIVQLGDLAKCTNIMANHRQRVEEMRKNMSNEDRELYEGYFDLFHEHSLKQAGCAGPSNLKSTSISNSIADCLLLKRPKTRVIISTFSYTAFIKLVYFMPTCIKDLILENVVEKFFNLKFKGQRSSLEKTD